MPVTISPSPNRKPDHTQMMVLLSCSDEAGRNLVESEIVNVVPRISKSVLRCELVGYVGI